MTKINNEGEAIWGCKIGATDRSKLPSGSDNPMRKAVEKAYFELTGEHAEFLFSGWGEKLTDSERAVVDNEK